MCRAITRFGTCMSLFRTPWGGSIVIFTRSDRSNRRVAIALDANGDVADKRWLLRLKSRNLVTTMLKKGSIWSCRLVQETATVPTYIGCVPRGLSMSDSSGRQTPVNQQRQLPVWSIKLLDAGVVLALFTALLYVGGYARLESFYGHFGRPDLAREAETAHMLMNSLSAVGFLIFVLSVLFVAGLIIWITVAWIRHKGPLRLQCWLSAEGDLPVPIYAFNAMIVGFSVLGVTVAAGHASGQHRAVVHVSQGSYVTLYDHDETPVGSLQQAFVLERERISHRSQCFGHMTTDTTQLIDAPAAKAR